MNSKKVKALVLFSGGLDSVLAMKILEKQGIETTGICFSSSFFGADKAQKIAKTNNIKIVVKDFNKEILSLVKNPPHGLGKNMNPCIDCHATMFEKAQEFAEENNYDFLASGEVLGQRPFSQNKEALLKVAKIADEEILRPLSAQLLPETKFEKAGLVDREKLLDIQGRQRNRQIELAKELGVKEFEAPAGGCLLTDPGFASRLKKALEELPEINSEDVDLLKWGRVYWAKLKNKPVLVVIGRKKEDNDNLRVLNKKSDLLLTPQGVMGPDILIRAFGKNLAGSKNVFEVLVSEDQPEGLVDKNFKNIDDLIQKVVDLGGWYITNSRGSKIEFGVFKD